MLNMKKKTLLYIFIEGLDDETFIKGVFGEDIKYKYKPKYKQYTQLPKGDYNKNVIKIMNNIDSGKLTNSDYIYLVDFDSKNSVNKGKVWCITSLKKKVVGEIKKIKKEIIKKEQLKKRVYDKDIGLLIDLKKIFVVKEEIESWYLAGISDYKKRKWDLPKNIEETTKEKHFDEHIPQNKTRKEFQFEIIDKYSLKKAINSNASLKYFVDKNAIKVK